jgi:hypothetical protein
MIGAKNHFGSEVNAPGIPAKIMFFVLAGYQIGALQ